MSELTRAILIAFGISGVLTLAMLAVAVIRQKLKLRAEQRSRSFRSL